MDSFYLKATMCIALQDTVDESTDRQLFEAYIKRGRGMQRRQSISMDEQDALHMLAQLADHGCIAAKREMRIPEVTSSQLIAIGESDPSLLKSYQMGKEKAEYDAKGKGSKASTKGVIKRGPKCKCKAWGAKPIKPAKVPMPVLRVPNLTQKVTMEDVPKLRKKIIENLENYYHQLRLHYVSESHRHWATLHVDEIASPYLRHKFRRVFETYSPLRTADAFVQNPWIPSLKFIKEVNPLKHLELNDPHGAAFTGKMATYKQMYPQVFPSTSRPLSAYSADSSRTPSPAPPRRF